MSANYTLIAKSVRHPAHVLPGPPKPNRAKWSLCGRRFSQWTEPITVPNSVSLATIRVCKTCLRSLATPTNDADRIRPELDTGAVERSLKLAGNGVREIPGRLFRVKGESDIYTVFMPADDEIATGCTCRAAKVHPEIVCKHVVKVMEREIEG